MALEEAFGEPPAQNGEPFAPNPLDDPEGDQQEEWWEDMLPEEAFGETPAAEATSENDSGLITKAKRKATVQELNKQVKAARLEHDQLRLTAWFCLGDAGYMRDPGQGEARGPNIDIPPFAAEISHTHDKLITVGGFVACRRCGRYASERKAKLFGKDCPREIKAGYAAPIKALLDGRLPPNANRWPDM